MPLFDGLNLFEIIMLVLGVLFFVALAIVMVSCALRGKPYAKMLPFFAIPIIMMAWSSIQSIEFSKDVLTIKTNVVALETNPEDTTAASSLKVALANVSGRPSSDPATSTLIARAALAVGDEKTANDRLDQALQKNPKFAEAENLRTRMQVEANLPALTEKVENQPSEAANAALKQSVASLTSAPVLNPVTLSNIARAQAALGDRAAAIANVNKALRINPNTPGALQVKARIQPPG
jgi:tetratricopeptide (TPR) repeat protein